MAKGCIIGLFLVGKRGNKHDWESCQTIEHICDCKLSEGCTGEILITKHPSLSFKVMIFCCQNIDVQSFTLPENSLFISPSSFLKKFSKKKRQVNLFEVFISIKDKTFLSFI